MGALYDVAADLVEMKLHGLCVDTCQATPRLTRYGDTDFYEGQRVRPGRARGPHESARARIGCEAWVMIRRGTA
jgi:hypothetical protein